MSERIRELAEQAKPLDQNGQKVRGLTSEYHDQWIEKFAELIIRECNQAVLKVPCYYKDYRSQIEEVVINDCARVVLEHFGVE